MVPIYDKLKENHFSEIGYTLDECYFIPGIYYAEVGGETDHTVYDYNYIFRFAKDNEATATVQQPETVQSVWASDAKGWWIQNSDGTYLTNAWYQDPTSGLWYYMGADGYMLTNATTPDGLQVDANGVWVQ